MKKYIKDNPPVLYYGIAIAFLFLAALISAACGVVTLVPAGVNTESHTYTIAPALSAEPTETQALTGVVCNSGGLNVRTGAGTDNEVLEILPDGTPVTLTGQTQVISVIAWYEIASPLHGWVFGRYICD